MSFKRLKVIIAILTISILVILTGCGQNKKASAPADNNTTGQNNQATQTAQEKPRKKIVIGQNGSVCQAPLIIAYEKGFLKEEGIDAELVKGDHPTLRDGLATGKIDVSDGLVVTWLKPIQGGLDINFTLGIHTGCIQVLVPKDSPIKGFKDLKGKTIGISGGIGGGSMNFGYRSILRDGLDVKDFQWRDYPGPQLITALEKGEVQAIIAGEQISQEWVQNGKTRIVRSSTHDKDYKEEYCCLLAIRGAIVRDDPETAKAITRAVYKASKWVDGNREETVKILLEKKHVLGEYQYNLDLLKGYNYIPDIKGGKEAIRVSIDELKKLGLFKQDVDTDKETEKIFKELEGVDK